MHKLNKSFCRCTTACVQIENLPAKEESFGFTTCKYILEKFPFDFGRSSIKNYFIQLCFTIFLAKNGIKYYYNGEHCEAISQNSHILFAFYDIYRNSALDFFNDDLSFLRGHLKFGDKIDTVEKCGKSFKQACLDAFEDKLTEETRKALDFFNLIGMKLNF